MIDNDVLPERIDAEPAGSELEPRGGQAPRLMVVLAFVSALAMLVGGFVGYDRWRDRGGDGYLAGIASEPSPVWSVPVDRPLLSANDSLTAVGEDRLLVGPSATTTALRLLSLDDGRELWRHQLLGWLDLGPRDLVFFASPDGDVVGYASGRRLVLLDPRTGTTLHDTTLGTAGDVIYDAQVHGRALYVALSGAHEDVLLRLDAADPGAGAVWEKASSAIVREDGTASPPGHDAFCVAGDLVLFGPGTFGMGDACRGIPSTFSVITRQVQIEATGEDDREPDAQSDVAVEDHRESITQIEPELMFSVQPLVLDAESGREVPWMEPPSSSVQHVVTDESIIRLGAYGSIGDVRSLARDGEALWVQPSSANDAMLSPWGVAAWWRGEVAMLDLDSGEQRWSAPLFLETVATTRLGPVLAVSGGEIIWFDGETGRELARHPAGADSVADWVGLSGNEVLGEGRRQVLMSFAGPGAGQTVRAYDASGTLRWEYVAPAGQEVLVRGDALLAHDGSTLSRLG